MRVKHGAQSRFNGAGRAGASWCWLVLGLIIQAAVAAPADADAVRLDIRAAPRDFTNLATAGAPNMRDPATWLVVGRFNPPNFSIPDIRNLRLSDASGRPLPLQVEQGSVFREFGDIVALRLAFALPPAALSNGLPRLEWGAAITGAVREIAAIRIAPAEFARVRTFAPQPEGGAAEAPQVATVEIIADSHADQYYLWYLLPIALIFGLLLARKFRAGK